MVVGPGVLVVPEVPGVADPPHAASTARTSHRAAAEELPPSDPHRKQPTVGRATLLPVSHWSEWHKAYDDPGSPLSRRLAAVRSAVVHWLDRAPAGPLRVVSLCSGQGRDLAGALQGHPRAREVRALQVEADPHNAAVAAAFAAEAGLDGVRTLEADASLIDNLAGAMPADLVLACGIFGNISDDDIRHFVACLPMLCAPRASAIWTRHRRPPDLTPQIRDWFDEGGFEEVSFVAPESDVFAVGHARMVCDPVPPRPGTRLFTFVGDGYLPA